MKRFLRWLVKVVTSAVTLVLVFVMLPHAVKLAARLMPDESGAAIKASAVITAKLQNSARLETLRVEEEGVLDYSVKPAFLPTVAEITAKYRYEASFGVDLSKVAIRLTGNHLTFLLPECELIQDSITPTEIYRDDYWYPWIKDEKYETLFEEERAARRTVYLTGEKSDALWSATVSAFEKTIATWMQDLDAQLTFTCEKAPIESPAP